MTYLIDSQKIRNFPSPPPPIIDGIITAPEKVELPKTIKVALEQTKSIALMGENFLEDTIIGIIPHGVTDLNEAVAIEYELISSNEIRLKYQGIKEGEFDLLVNTDKAVTTRIEKAIVVKYSPWIDFRSGGDEISDSDFKKKSNLKIKRNSQGLEFFGDKGWDCGALYLPLVHDRQEKNTYEFIFYQDRGIHMVGIGRENFNPDNRSQIYESEVTGYFSSQTFFNRFYGNGGNHYVGINVSRNAYKKLILEDNGEGGANYYMYELPSGKKEDWNDTSILKGSGKMPQNTFKNIGTKIAPFFIPYSANQIKYTAVKLS